MGEPAAIKLVRFLWAGPLTVVASPIAVSRIRTVVVMILNPAAKFLSLGSVFSIGDTVIGSACAVYALFAMTRYSPEPIRAYRSLANERSTACLR